jgi:2-dehydropantoate 2-reductase
MRIGIIGLGAIGGATAARLLASQRDGETFVLACGSEERAARLCKSGLRVRDRSTELVAHSSHFVASLGDDDAGLFDLIILCVRGDATAAALESAAACLSPDGVLVSLQNGLPDARVAERLGSRRALGAMIGWSATSTGEGLITITGRGGFVLGAHDPRSVPHAQLEQTRELLARAFPTRLTDNLIGARFAKLALNCAISTLGAVSGLSFGELAQRKVARTLALRCIAEVVQIAAARSVRMGKVSGLDPRWLADFGRADLHSLLTRPLRHALFLLAASQRPHQRSGMLERLRAGRTSGQAEELNGAVVEQARLAGLTAPLNAALLARVHAIERSEATIAPEALELLASTPA